MSIDRKLYMLQMDAQGMAFRHRPHPEHLLDGRMRASFGEFRESIEDLLVSKRIKHPPEDKAIVERSTPRNNNMFVRATEPVIAQIRARLKENGFGFVQECFAASEPLSEPDLTLAALPNPIVL